MPKYPQINEPFRPEMVTGRMESEPENINALRARALEEARAPKLAETAAKPIPSVAEIANGMYVATGTAGKARRRSTRPVVRVTGRGTRA
jgi:hypothetical protein